MGFHHHRWGVFVSAMGGVVLTTVRTHLNVAARNRWKSASALPVERLKRLEGTTGGV